MFQPRGFDGERYLQGESLGVRALVDLVMQAAKNDPITFHLMATEFCEKGTNQKAEFCARQAIHLAHAQKQDPLVMCAMYKKLADALKGQAKQEEALHWLQEAYNLADSVPLPMSMAARMARGIAETLRTLGRAEEAGNWERRFEEILGAMFRNG